MTERIPDAVLDLMADVGAWSPVDGTDKRDCVLAALAVAEAAGWKLVPREPTEAMSRAGFASSSVPAGTGEGAFRSVWRLTWDAAPSAARMLQNEEKSR